MHQDRILHLFTRKLSGTLTPPELAELEGLLAQHPEMLPSLKLLEQFWKDREHTETIHVEASLQKVLSRLDDFPTEAPSPDVQTGSAGKRRVLVPAFRWLAAAVIAGLLVLGGVFSYGLFRKNTAAPEVALVEKQNAKGVKSTITLPEGSKIWLNADSKLSYPVAFNDKTREVYLRGEAFFDIRKNPDKPFIIHLANGTIHVLGTSFNVRAYDDEDKIETSVSTGKVAFIPKSPRQTRPDTVFLTRDKKVSYRFGSGELVTQATRSSDDKAWIESRLIFKAMTLEDIARELERNFGKKVVFRSQAPRQYRLTGSFHNNSLEEIMFYLSKTKDFSYQITNDELLIAEDPGALSAPLK
jgi:ferric-dicitrate binding protein FerR (iron transport regulator)